MFHTSGFALKCRTASIGMCYVMGIVAPCDDRARSALRRATIFLHRRKFFFAAVQKTPKFSSFFGGEIEGPAIKKGIRRKNHMASGRRNRRFKLQ